MKSDKELINQIRTLKQIKPEMEWVALSKARIIGHEMVGHRQSLISLISSFVFQCKAGFAGILLAGLAGGTVIAAQYALPGDSLYQVKKASEKAMAIVTGQDKSPSANLLLAAKRLEDIDAIAQKNLVKNLPAAFYEYKSAKATAKKDVAALVKQNPDNASAIVKDAGVAMMNIDEKEKQVYGVLGLEQNASSTDDGSEAASDKEIVGSLIDYFKKDAVLPDDQATDLAKVKELYTAGDYGQAINYYLSSSLNK